MTDENEPEPGTTEWLLAQLSGGRIDSRRERREAEAALEAAGVSIPDASTADPSPANPPAPPVEPAVDSPAPPVSAEQSDEKPRARFSWEKGTLEAVESAESAESESGPEPVRFETPAAPAPQPAGADASRAAEPAAASDSDSAIPFMWNLAPTSEPDPAVNPHAELLEPHSAEPLLPPASAAPLVVPKLPAPVTPEPHAQEPPASEAPAAEPATSEPATPEPAAPEAATPVPIPPAPVTPPAPAHAPLPPGTTAYEFDPFAQDLFAPRPQASTPVPSVDEFTMPDESTVSDESTASLEHAGNAAVAEGATAEASAPTQQTQPQAPETTEVSSDWDDISAMLGAHPQTVDNALVSPMPPINELLPSFDVMSQRSPTATAAEPARAPGRPAHPPIEHGRAENPMNRWLLIVAAVLLAVLVGVALFAVGRAIAASRSSAPVAAVDPATPTHTPTATPTPTPTPTPTAPPGSGPLPAGQTYQWDQLRGGECINPFATPWAQDFAVVDCSSAHSAQLVYTAPFSSDPGAAFPGEQAISSQINLLCSKPGVVDMSAAAAYNDVQLVASYPVTAAQWNAGQRNYYCFVTRSSGQSFSSSIAGPGPTQ